MSTSAPTGAPKRTGLPGAFLAFCVVLGLLVGADAAVTLLTLTSHHTLHRTRTFPATQQLEIDAGSHAATAARR